MRGHFFNSLVLVFALGATLARAAEPPRVSASTDEQLAMPQFPSGWVKVTVRPGDQELTEYVPVGQSAEKWQSKISVETYRYLNLPLDALQRRAVAQIHDSCDGVVEGKFQSGVNNGYPSAFWTLGCKRHRKLGVGETRYTKAIQGTDTLYVISRVWRTARFDDSGPDIAQGSIQEAVAFLTSTVLCRTDAPAHPCPAMTQEKPKR